MTAVSGAETAEGLLRELGNAVHALALYAPDHPRTKAAFDRLDQAFSTALTARQEVPILFLDGRVVLDGVPLPGGEAAARGLARFVKGRKKDRLVIRHGATGAEAREFLAALVAAQTPESWTGTPHMRLEELRAGVRVADAAEAAGGHLVPQVDALKNVWSGISGVGRLEFDTLRDIVSVLSRTVTTNFGAMLPLVPLKSHDEYTFTHILNVGILSMGLAEAAGLPPGAVGDVGVGALLHDVGKSLVPLDILNKPGKLTDQEFTVVKRHPVDGARLLLRTPGAPEIAVAVAFEHHVRYDGIGYPALPHGWRTSLASSITQIADYYDALRTHRPYRNGMPREKILAIMREESGGHFDPQLLRIFFDTVIPREGGEAVP